MAKMISKFHKLIQSKLLWIVFVGVIVCGFVLLPVAANLSNKGAMEENAPGILNDEPVPIDEYRSARSQTFMSLLIMSLMYGQELSFNEEVRNYVDEVAWKRLITLRVANDLGFQAFNSEITSYIKNSQLFAPDGQFNPEIYSTFKKRFLEMRGFTGGDYEKHVAEEIALGKTQRMVAQAALVPPSRIERSLKSLSDQFKLKYVKIGEAIVTNQVETSIEDAQRVYEENPDRYRHPEQVDLKYVYLSYSNYLEQVENISAERIEDYYNENIDDYLVEAESPASTNLNEEAEAAAEDTADSEQPVYTPFEEVKEEIASKLRLAAAREIAIDQANKIVFELPPDRNGVMVDFDKVIADAGLEVRQLEPFSVNSLPDLEDGPVRVAREAVKLRANPDEYFSDAIPSDNGVYVLALEEIIPPFVPEFEKVKDRALADAREENIQQALSEKVRDIMDSVQESKDKETTLDKLLSDSGLEAEETDYFQLMNASEALPEWMSPRVISQRIVYRNSGEFIDPVVVDKGRLLAYVSDRKAGASDDLIELRDSVYQSLRQDRVSRLYDDWQGYLLKRANFIDQTIDRGQDEAEEG